MSTSYHVERHIDTDARKVWDLLTDAHWLPPPILPVQALPLAKKSTSWRSKRDLAPPDGSYGSHRAGLPSG